MSKDFELYRSDESEVVVHEDRGNDVYHHRIARVDVDLFDIKEELTYWN